jgi:ethanolamine utilization protein EutA
MMTHRGFKLVGQSLPRRHPRIFGVEMDQGDSSNNNDAKASKEKSPEDEGTILTGPPLGHALDDHTMGDVFFHEHGPDADHEHDDDIDDLLLDQNPLWMADNVRLISVGIDVGSSGTQVIFSRLHLRRMAEDMSSRYFVVKRETLFQSPVSLTPYESATRISNEGLGRILDQAYEAAGLSPDDIDAGAVILTGEALRREFSGNRGNDIAAWW